MKKLMLSSIAVGLLSMNATNAQQPTPNCEGFTEACLTACVGFCASLKATLSNHSLPLKEGWTEYCHNQCGQLCTLTACIPPQPPVIPQPSYSCGIEVLGVVYQGQVTSNYKGEFDNGTACRITGVGSYDGKTVNTINASLGYCANGWVNGEAFAAGGTYPTCTYNWSAANQN